jgi:hypothetical protein
MTLDLRLDWPVLASPVDVSAVVNADHVDDSADLVDAIDHAVGAAACGLISVKFARQGLADPVRLVKQRPGMAIGADELRGLGTR